MAINPEDITTVQVSELPPAEITAESLIAHQIGDVLNKASIQQLIEFLRPEITINQYEIKIIRAPDLAYINDNFDMTPGATQGLGKPDGIWAGYAICNGNNGTDNDDGITYIGFGANRSTIGQLLGEETHTLTESQLPSLSKPVTLPVSDAENSGGDHQYVNATNIEPSGTKSYPAAINFGGGEEHNNMQPSRVMLKIMKL